MSTRIYNIPSMNASPQYAPSSRRSRSPSPSPSVSSSSSSRRSRSPSTRKSRSPSPRRNSFQQINEYHVTIVCLLISIILYAIYLRR
jgi:hypothetical protein